MDRTQLQELALARLVDAEVLLEKARWTGAFYLCGYVIECSLKACLLRHLGESAAIFGDKEYLKKLAKCWTHDLEELMILAGLEAAFGKSCGANLTLSDFWGVTKDWKESSRYEQKSEAEAKQLYEAVSHNPDGVFRWIQSYW